VVVLLYIQLDPALLTMVPTAAFVMIVLFTDVRSDSCWSDGTGPTQNVSQFVVFAVLNGWVNVKLYDPAKRLQGIRAMFGYALLLG